MTSPNIVLVMADQHRGDMMGCAGDPGVLTPNLDRLASTGTRSNASSNKGQKASNTLARPVRACGHAPMFTGDVYFRLWPKQTC